MRMLHRKLRYLRQKRDKLRQLLVGFIGLQLKNLQVGLKVSVLLKKLSKTQEKQVKKYI